MSHLCRYSLLYLNSEIIWFLGIVDMNQNTIAIAAVLAAAMLTGIFATPMAYADESETSTEQELKQKNVGSGESTNTNCGTNSIDGGLALAICGEIEIGADADGLGPSDPGAERTSHDDW